MASQQTPLTHLSEACTAGRDLLGSIYAYRSISRTLPPLEEVANPLKLCRSLCLLFEDECSLFQNFDNFNAELLEKVSAAVQWLVAENPGGTSLGMSSSAAICMADALFLVHLLDCVKIAKPGLGLDCLLYENALERVLVSTDSDSMGAASEFRYRLKTCKSQTQFLTTPWSVMKSLVNVLRDVEHVGRILSRLVEFLVRSLQAEQEGVGSGMIVHERHMLLGALPIALYLHCFVSKRGMPEEGIPLRQIDACVKLLRKHPVVPGMGDIAVEVAKPLSNVQLGKETGRKVMVPSVVEMDRKSRAALEQRYSLKFSAREAREAHDCLCEDIMDFLKEANRLKRERNHQDSTFIQGSCDRAFDLSLRLLQHLSLWQSKVLSLHAWRISTRSIDRRGSECPYVFEDHDLPHVSILVSCLRGMASLFTRAWKGLLPFLQQKSQDVCNLFFNRFFKKAGNPSDARIQELIDTLRLMRDDRFFGMARGNESSRSGNQPTSFDATRLDCLGQLRSVVEELIAIDEAYAFKARFSGLRSKLSRTIGAGAIKECKDVLRDILRLEVVLSAKSHVVQISDLSGLCFSEAYFELHGVANHALQSEPFRLAKAALESSSGSCVDAAFAALSIYEDGSVAILHRFKVQNLYYEICQEALSALDKVICMIVNKTFSDLSWFAGESILRLKNGQTRAQTPGLLHKKYEKLFESSLRIAGCKVDAGSALAMKVRELFQANAKTITDSLSDPTCFKATEESLQLLRHAHSILSHHISLPPWSQIWKDKLDPMPKPTCGSIVVEIFREFKYYTFLNEFRGFEVKSCPIKPTSLGPTVNVCATVFGVPHILSVRKLIGCQGVEDIVAQVLEWISSELEKDVMPRVEELMQKDVIEELEENDALVRDSAINMIESLDSFRRAHAPWQIVMDKLESIGNSLAFLHLLDCLNDAWLGDAVEKGEEGRPIRDEASGSVAYPSADEVTKPVARLLTRGLQTVEKALLEWVYGMDHRNEVHQQLSALFMWAAYISGNDAYGGKAIGDGFLWALRSIVGILGQDSLWKAFSWGTTYDHAATLEYLLRSNHTALDERALQVRIRQWSAVWDHITFVLPALGSRASNSCAAPLVEPDPPLAGFFGSMQSLGISKLPQVPLRESSEMEASQLPFTHRAHLESPLSSALTIENKHMTRASSAEPYGRKATSQYGQFSPRYSSRLVNYGSSKYTSKAAPTKNKRYWRR